MPGLGGGPVIPSGVGVAHMAVRDSLNFTWLAGAKIQREDQAEALKIQVENQWIWVDFFELSIYIYIY